MLLLLFFLGGGGASCIRLGGEVYQFGAGSRASPLGLIPGCVYGWSSSSTLAMSSCSSLQTQDQTME